MKLKSEYIAIGCMSGTSVDGLDISLCKFNFNDKGWNYKLIKAVTIAYDSYWQNTLRNIISCNARTLSKVDKEFGAYIGEGINAFLTDVDENVDFIVSHGHTVFHEPSNNICMQIGNGNTIHAAAKLPVIFDLRTLDISLGGQGAPLVPIGDQLLFKNYDSCLNLGGFANISLDINNERIAFDIVPVNIILNRISRKMDREFDENGQMGKKGKIIPELLVQLNNLEFYQITPPKSLGIEWLNDNVIDLIDGKDYLDIDILRTFYEHIAIQIASVISKYKPENILITGGGCYNDFLLSLISEKCNTDIIIPEKEIIDFKEAIIFAFLGVLRIRNENNCLSSVTGATKDSCGGSIIGNIK